MIYFKVKKKTVGQQADEEAFWDWNLSKMGGVKNSPKIQTWKMLSTNLF